MHFSVLLAAASMMGVDFASASPLTIQLKARNLPTKSSGLGSRKRSGNATEVPLIDWIQGPADLQWYSTISVGTPPQNFTVLFDTGSTDLVLPRNNCTTCGNHSLFNPSESTTFSPLPGDRMQVTFATGGNTIPFAVDESIDGSVVTDAVTLAGLRVPAQPFLLCDVYAEALDTQPMDGIFGLGVPGASELSTINNTVTSWYWQLYKSGVLSSPEFSFYIIPGHEFGAELTLGGTDPSKFKGEIATLDLDTVFSQAVGEWAIDVPAVRVDGEPLLNNSQPLTPSIAILDTGTAFIMGPDNDTVASLYAHLSPDIVPVDEAGSWGGPCDLVERVAADFTFTMGNATGPHHRTFDATVPRSAFNLGAYPGQPGICQTLFVSPLVPSVDPFSGSPYWIIGGPLLKEYYTVWNGIDLTVGFAEPRKPCV